MNVSGVALEVIGWPVDPSLLWALLRGFPALVSFAVSAPAGRAVPLFIVVAPCEFDHFVELHIAALTIFACVVVVAHRSPARKRHRQLPS